VVYADLHGARGQELLEARLGRCARW
jgi:hypothetical protein